MIPKHGDEHSQLIRFTGAMILLLDLPFLLLDLQALWHEAPEGSQLRRIFPDTEDKDELELIQLVFKAMQPFLHLLCMKGTDGMYCSRRAAKAGMFSAPKIERFLLAGALWSVHALLLLSLCGALQVLGLKP